MMTKARRGGNSQSYLVHGYGAVWGGIVRVHNEVCTQLAVRGHLDISCAPRGQVQVQTASVKSRQSGTRLRSFVADIWPALTSRRIDVRVDSAPAFRLFSRSRFHVVIVHDLNFRRPDVHRISTKQRYYRQLLHRWALRRVDRVVVNSESTLTELKDFMPSCIDRAHVLPLPVDHVPFQARPPRASSSRIRVLSFGHARNKGVDRILELMANRPELDLVVICPEDAWTQLWAPEAERVGVSDRVTVLSEISDDELFAEYARCDVFCMLSTYEGYGLPIAEALSLETPTVISAVPVLIAPPPPCARPPRGPRSS